ncbi:MAG: UDP-3-O-acyl-N-acetylglucosamine deacetylase [Xenococcus sp. MO_188.B8]|nr:UDP-3-O-acyl-N-acetylglucosamine deacetylase [Xenococcus sp. MO_188.B8]
MLKNLPEAVTAFTLSGVGLHSGLVTTVKIMPAQPGAGRYFVRVDQPQQPIIPANLDSVSQTTLSTELAQETTSGSVVKVRTVEHLLAALSASGIQDARIEIDGAEVPLLDGSAKLWADAIAENICHNQTIEHHSPPPLVIQQPVVVQEQDAFVAAMPASETRFTYGIDFPYAVIGNQWHSWTLNREDFATEIAPARTFGFAEEIEQLQKAGLIKGGSLDNALVCSHQGWINPPLRFTNEPARHKLLDLVGDLSLLGTFPQAHFLAYKASHKLHIQLAKKISLLISQ